MNQLSSNGMLDMEDTSKILSKEQKEETAITENKTPMERKGRKGQEETASRLRALLDIRSPTGKVHVIRASTEMSPIILPHGGKLHQRLRRNPNH